MSRIYVDRISPYQSGSVQVDGLSLDTGSLATTGSNTFEGNQVINGTNGSPGNTFQAKDGAGTGRLTVQNSTLAGLTGFNTVINGSTLHAGKLSVTGSIEASENGEVKGTNTAPGQTFTVRDGNSTPILQINNATLAGLVGFNTVMNGSTLHDGKFSVTGSIDIGENGLVKGTTGTPGQTFTVQDGNSTPKLQVNNSTLKGFTNVDITINGTVLVDDAVALANNDPLPSVSPAAGGTLAVSGSVLYFHNGTSWSQIS